MRGAAALTALAWLVYAPLLRGDFLWDDGSHVFLNATLRSLSGLREIWLSPQASIQYYPLTFTAFWLEFHLWGLHVAGYHAVNICLHALNGVLLWRVLRRLDVPGAWLTAAVFTVHPVALESVAWISELKNVLSAFFFFSSALLYLKFEDEPQPRRYAASFGCFISALLSKSVTATLPACLLVLALFRRGKIVRRDLYLLAPFFTAGLLFSSLTTRLEGAYVAAAVAPAWNLTLAQRCLIAGRALWFYPAKIVWPHPLCFVYPRWPLDAGNPLFWFFPAAALAAFAALAVLWRRRGERGPACAALYFAATLSPCLGFVDFYPMRFSFVADHYQYLACAGPIALFCALAQKATRRSTPKARFLLSALLLANLVVVGWAEGRKFRNAEALWTDTVAKNPKSALGHEGLGLILARRGDVAAALPQLEAAAARDPWLIQTQLALAYLWPRAGKPERAVEAYERALALGVRDPQILGDYQRLKAGLRRR